MCSYTSLSSGGGTGGGGGGHGSSSGGYAVDSAYPKKVKKQKVPKRGPGVAELEKILRDQEKKDHTIVDKTKNIEGTFPVVSQLSSSYNQRQSPILTSQKSQPINNNLPFSSNDPNPNPNHNPFSPPSTTFCGNCSNNSSPQVFRDAGHDNGGSGKTVHEHGYLPTMWNSCLPNVDIGGPGLAPGIPFPMRSTNVPIQLFPSSNSMTQRSQYSPTPMINFFPQSVALSSSTTPSSVVMYQGIEPPSNQTSDHHYNSVWPEEDKTVGTKRSFPFFKETPPIPHLYTSVPAFSTQFSRQDMPISSGSHNTTNLEQIETVSRDEKMAGSERSTDYGVAKSNFLLFGSPTIPSPSTHIPQPEQSKSNPPLPFQENIGELSQHRPGPAIGSICYKPFQLPGEQKSKVETNFSLNNDWRIETREDGIDLDLRL